jgi:hypothetical protein
MTKKIISVKPCNWFFLVYVETGGTAVSTPLTFTLDLTKTATRKYAVRFLQLKKSSIQM